MNSEIIKLAAAAFTENGLKLAQEICEKLESDCIPERLGKEHPYRQWVEEVFGRTEAILFVGALGIAVRGIAPHIVHKAEDPAVIVVDEGGNFVIPVLSGHIGGANRLASRIAKLIDATPVITTATDVHGIFAVDTWAVSQGMKVLNPEKIKEVSSKLLAGGDVICKNNTPGTLAGKAPGHVIIQDGQTKAMTAYPEVTREESTGEATGTQAGERADFMITVHREAQEGLYLLPRTVALGVGCRRDTPADSIRRAFREFQERTGLLAEAVSGLYSIDLKKDEAGLIEFAAEMGIPFKCFSSEELLAVEGDFTASSFVKSITGVDNVCERSAVLGSGGEIMHPKEALGGVTFAAAFVPAHWSWDRD